MNRNDFITISIRGRVSFAICCFENALKYFNCSSNDWKIILERMWSYTDIDFFDDWHYSMAEYLPESILECGTYEEDFEYVNEEQFEELTKLYKNANDVIKKLIKLVFDVGISEFYGRLENYGQSTLVNLEILINFMSSNGIPLPDINKFKIFSYDDGDGWGNRFVGVEYSDIL